ncbi:4'-phosphopantetheinyl transferase family protein [Asanoa siamensis]|uniref:4'-phosphopantetheinyl transferase family protein n=1 Tax=Asanoa siamensis TaxID=926357 RepID=UPI001EF28063|nr:4'-phosphopantetheinyl transferase superfamily protein [Asanoa siamensis]
MSCEVFTDDPDEAPFPGEESAIAGAVEGRRREFITARRCARQALASLGVPAVPILSGPRREPLWPAGVVGSITHCAGYRAAVVARRADLAGLGIDAEPDLPLPDGVASLVVLPGERARLAADAPCEHWERLVFSAKESVFKVWYPLTGRWLGFEDASLTFDADYFRAEILVDGTRIDGGPALTELRGRYLLSTGLIVTAVAVAA